MFYSLMYVIVQVGNLVSMFCNLQVGMYVYLVVVLEF